nr:hypothetical protein [Pandoravirus massiliensis]
MDKCPRRRRGVCLSPKPFARRQRAPIGQRLDACAIRIPTQERRTTQKKRRSLGRGKHRITGPFFALDDRQAKRGYMAHNTNGAFSAGNAGAHNAAQLPYYALGRSFRAAAATSTCADLLTSAAPEWEPKTLSYAGLLKKCVRTHKRVLLFCENALFFFLLPPAEACGFHGDDTQTPLPSYPFFVWFFFISCKS